MRWFQGVASTANVVGFEVSELESIQKRFYNRAFTTIPKIMKKVLITGINGQDGSYLAELLLERGDDVHGIIRPDSRLAHIGAIAGELSLVEADITNAASISDVIKSIQPDEIYNLAAQSHVRQSFDEPVRTAAGDGHRSVECL